jgi:hypothetical protein
MSVCLKAILLCEVEVCVPSSCYKQIIEAVNRDNISVLTDGKLWAVGGGTQKREMQEIQLWYKRRPGVGEAWIKVVIRTKLPLCVSNHHVMWTYGGVELGATYSKSNC